LAEAATTLQFSAWEKPDPKSKKVDKWLTFLTFKNSKEKAIVEDQVDLPIDDEFAVKIQRAWATMLLKTRYPENEYLGADGFDVEFSVWVTGIGGVYGQLWSPSSGLTKELMDLGFALADYCRTSEAERAKRRGGLLYRLEDFARRAGQSI